jgi:hypothetical protein
MKVKFWRDSERLGYFMRVDSNGFGMTYEVSLCVYECMTRKEKKRVRDFMYKRCVEEMMCAFAASARNERG